MIDEGIIKFRSCWKKSPAPADRHLNAMLAARNRLHQLKLIGHDSRHNVGYGNISIRCEPTSSSKGIEFIISGSQTGDIKVANNAAFSKVTHYDLKQNRVHSNGPVEASSESLTHAALYECDENIKGVVHVHHMELWQSLLGKVPTTDARVPYGTPEMAAEIVRLSREVGFEKVGLLAMAGHKDGVIGFGNAIEQATQRIESAYLAIQEGASVSTISAICNDSSN